MKQKQHICYRLTILNTAWVYGEWLKIIDKLG